MAHPHQRGPSAPRGGRGRQLRDECESLEFLQEGDGHQVPIRKARGDGRRATKILITPTWKIEGSVAKVEACNNAFDAAPTWEDITAQVAINRVFNFTNETKTAEKWGVDVRFTITKNEGYEGEVSISGFGGAYE